MIGAQVHPGWCTVLRSREAGPEQREPTLRLVVSPIPILLSQAWACGLLIAIFYLILLVVDAICRCFRDWSRGMSVYDEGA